MSLGKLHQHQRTIFLIEHSEESFDVLRRRHGRSGIGLSSGMGLGRLLSFGYFGRLPLPPARPRPPQREAGANGYAMEPCRIPAATGKCSPFEEQAYEHLLGCVLGVVAIPHEPPTDPPDTIAKPFHEPMKRKAIRTFACGKRSKLLIARGRE